MASQGNATFNFGSAPGTNIVTVAVTGQAAITGSSDVEAYLTGVDSTADHNAYEHGVLDLIIRVVSITAGVGFTLQAVSPTTRLTGQVKCRWVWA